MKDNYASLTTIVFVDYESWFWALYNQYGETPDVREFIQDIKKRGKLKQIYFFGDFTKEEMAREKNKLRTVTNQIIDCATEGTPKNYTDFIMLDYIYRSILQDQDANEIEQYILVTGDGHFHSVVAYLTTFKDKIVGIYGVEGSLSGQLKNCATWSVEIKPKGDLTNYQICVLNNIHFVSTQLQGILPTFSKTVEATAKHYKIDKIKCAAALSRLISDGYIDQKITNLPDGRGIQALFPKWDLIIEDGIWDPNNPLMTESDNVEQLQEI
jgi:hypothetical protein